MSINCQCCNLYILHRDCNAVHSTPPHPHPHPHPHHTPHTIKYLQRRKTHKSMQTSRHYHLYTKFADSCGYSRLKKLFVRVSSSELWARHLCRRFHSEIVRAKAFPRYRHLPNLSVCDSRRSPTSASLWPFRRQPLKTILGPRRK